MMPKRVKEEGALGEEKVGWSLDDMSGNADFLNMPAPCLNSLLGHFTTNFLLTKLMPASQKL